MSTYIPNIAIDLFINRIFAELCGECPDGKQYYYLNIITDPTKSVSVQPLTSVNFRKPSDITSDYVTDRDHMVFFPKNTFEAAYNLLQTWKPHALIF